MRPPSITANGPCPLPTNGVMASKRRFLTTNGWTTSTCRSRTTFRLAREALISPARSGDVVLNTQGWDNINMPRLGDVTVCKTGSDLANSGDIVGLNTKGWHNISKQRLGDVMGCKKRVDLTRPQTGTKLRESGRQQACQNIQTSFANSLPSPSSPPRAPHPAAPTS